MPDITLEPGGASERLATQLKADPSATLSRRAVSNMLGITPAMVDPALKAGIGLGLITSLNDMDYGRVYKAGPRLHLWTPPAGPAEPAAAAPNAPAAAPPAAPAPAPATKPAVKRARKAYLPELQLSLLKVETLPLPVGRGALTKGQTKYDATLDMLTADGQCLTGIPKAYDGALRKAITAYLKHRPKLKSNFLVRPTDAEHIGVWRVAAGDQAKALRAA